MLLTFTLDSNCLIDIEESRPAAPEVRALAGAHTAGTADVAVVAMSASERPKPGHSANNFSEFEDRLAALRLAHLNIVLPMLYWDISFWDHGLFADDAMVDLERRIHSILFPNVQFLWQDYCRDNGINPPSNTPPLVNGGIANVMFRPSGAIYTAKGTYSLRVTQIFTKGNQT